MTILIGATAALQLIASLALPVPQQKPTIAKVNVPLALVERAKEPDYETEVLKPFEKKRADAMAQVKQDCDINAGTVEDSAPFTCVLPPPPPPPLPEPVAETVLASSTVNTVTNVSISIAVSDLVGSYGYALAGGNCVDLAKAFGKNQPGNPDTWQITTHTPFIGAAALFYYQHVAVVVGLHPSDGTVELAHYNCPGCATRVPASSLRGFF